MSRIAPHALRLLLLALVAQTALAQDAYRLAWTGLVPEIDGILHTIHPRPDGFVVVGAYGWMPGDVGPMIARFDTAGRFQWMRLYDTSAASAWWHVGGTAVAPGGFFIVGGRERPAVLKIAENGDSLWLRTYGEERFAGQLTSATEAPDGGVDVAGEVYRAGLRVTFVMRLDARGDVVWTSSDTLDDEADAYRRVYEMRALPDGGVLTAGEVSFDGAPIAFVRRYDRTGRTVFERIYTDTSLVSAAIYGMMLLDDGDAILAGAIEQPPGPRHGAADAFAMRIDSTGVPRWISIERTNDLERFLDIALTRGGELLFVGGHSDETDRYQYTRLLVRVMTPDGAVVRDTTMEIPFGNPIFGDVVIGPRGELHLTGGLEQPGGFGPIGIVPAIARLDAVRAAKRAGPAGEWVERRRE